MTNRSLFITQRNEYDMMISIAKNTNVCPIFAISGLPAYLHDETFCLIIDSKRNLKSCSECIQKWLNEEEKRT